MLDTAAQNLANKFSTAESVHRALCFTPEALTRDEVIGGDSILGQLQLSSFKNLDALKTIVPSFSSHERIIAIGLLCNGLSRLLAEGRVNAQALELVDVMITQHLNEFTSYTPSILPLLEKLGNAGLVHIQELYRAEQASRGQCSFAPLSAAQKAALVSLCRLGKTGFVTAVGLLKDDPEFSADSSLSSQQFMQELATTMCQCVDPNFILNWARNSFNPELSDVTSRLALEVLRLRASDHLKLHVAEMQKTVADNPTGFSALQAKYHYFALTQPCHRNSFFARGEAPSASSIALLNEGLSILLKDGIRKLQQSKELPLSVPVTSITGSEIRMKARSTFGSFMSRLFAKPSDPSKFVSSVPVESAKEFDVCSISIHSFCRNLLDAFNAHPAFKDDTVSCDLLPETAREVFASSVAQLLDTWIPLIQEVRALDETKLVSYQDKHTIASSLGCATHVSPAALDQLLQFSKSNSPWEREVSLIAYQTAHGIVRRSAAGAVDLPYTAIMDRCRELLSDGEADVNANAAELFFAIKTDLNIHATEQRHAVATMFDAPVPPLAHGSRWIYIMQAARRHLALDESRGLKAAELCLEYNEQFLHQEVLGWFQDSLKGRKESLIAQPCERVFREMLARHAAGTTPLHYLTKDLLVTLLERWTERGNQ